MKTIDVSVVIVSYNVKALLIKCLETLYLFNSALELEVFVVDNNSNDGSADAISESFPEVQVIRNSLNAGFPAANNQAFHLATGKLILMLNPDTEFTDDSIVKLKNEFDKDSELGLAAPRLLNTDLSLQKSVWRFPTVNSIFFELHYLNFLNSNHNYSDQDWSKAFVADSFSGAAIIFKRELLSTVGYLDESMFWIEDVEFCYRASRNAVKMIYFPKASIIHHIGQSAKKNYIISLSNQIFNKIKYFRKHHNGFGAAVVTWMSFCHCVWKLVLFTILSPFRKMWKLKAKAYFYTLPKVFNPPHGII